MTRTLRLILFTICIGLARASAADSATIALSKVLPDLHLTLEVSADWSIEWYEDRAAAPIARIFRSATGGREAIVITASRLGPKYQGKSVDEVFTTEAMNSLGGMLGASVSRRAKNEFWDGAYFEYEISGAPPGTKVVAHTWMRLADGYLVQFQCYFLQDLSIPVETRENEDEKLERRYREILATIKAEPKRD